MKIYAHRGYSQQAPENTLAAFQAAVEAGADGIELDVTLSADDVPVVIHDDSLERTTDAYGPVNAMTAVELGGLDAGSWFDPAFSSEYVPTLAEVLQVAADLETVNVELKGGSAAPPNLAARTAEVLRAHGDPEQVLVSSFDPRVLWRLKQADPDWPLALLFGQKGAVGAMWRVWAKGLGVRMYHPSERLAERVARVLGDASLLNVWTVNDAERMLELQDLGVHGIITDDPKAAREALSGRA